jgi:hypothetical protein
VRVLTTRWGRTRTGKNAFLFSPFSIRPVWLLLEIHNKSYGHKEPRIKVGGGGTVGLEPNKLKILKK